jgi:hypothetical protein
VALRAVPDHPKFAHLKSLLGTTKAVTIGYLECIWHFTGRFTPQGNIGKYTDLAIETWLEWEGQPGELVAALLESGWLDRDAVHRILVHDWPHHADKATKQALSRGKLEFCVPTVRPLYTQSENTVPEIENAVHTVGTHEGSQNAKPFGMKSLPVPVPVPVPEPVPESGAEPEPRDSAFSPEDEFEQLYTAHPKKGDRGIAENYFAQSVTSGADVGEILRVHRQYCETVWAGGEGRFAPKLAQWLLDKGWRYPPRIKGPAVDDIEEILRNI